ncbi:hypothetical protein CPB84DRAFT_1826840 [Gymnopilus junonius]|uniref:Uncharacterized protein n=1 Tax=Gymnopilus junonius TaxID=109634 RepID=A0A9P5TJA8_GYMJU|nr:hypothetical protein CPB84DRAFT_1826840 [Gymnopilus junonius]
MLGPKFALFAPLAYLATRVVADTNVTVVDTDPAIVYSGQGTGDASICKVDANGNIQAGQAGCYNFPTQCTSSVAMSQNLDGKAGASFTFQGSGIYINSGLNDISPIYTVTLDGQATDVDGVRPSLGFTCGMLFGKSGLDPTAQHTISLTVKGPSPNRNMTTDPNGKILVFSLINFIRTTADPGSSSSNSTTVTSGSNGSNTANTSAGATIPSSSSGATSADTSTLPTTSTSSNSSTNTAALTTSSATDFTTASILRSGVLVLGAWATLGTMSCYVF